MPLTRIGSFLRSNLHALALDPLALASSTQPTRLDVSLQLGLLALHLIGLVVVTRLAHWPLWLAPVLLVAFSLPAFMRWRWRFAAEPLAPLIILYGAAVLRLVYIYALRRAVPDALDYGWALGLAAAWAALITLRSLGRLRLAAALVALAAAGLMVWLLWGKAPAGVTGSDPFAYVQMALDLAQRGTLLHRFPLAVLAAQLGLPTLPATHVGYVLPNAAGLAPTVWPPGYSVLLAAAYRIGGERLLLDFNGWVGLASLALTVAFTLLVTPRAHRRLAWIAAFSAAAIVATSPELLTRLITPLADGAALALTGLAVALALAALRSQRGSTYLYALLGALAGLSLAAAYSVRYTQVLVGPGLVVAVWFGLRPPRARLAFLLAFVVAAAAGAVPDLLYRLQLYGTPLRFGTGELALFSPQALPAALRQLGSEALSSREFGWLWPLTLVGGAYAWRRARRELLAVLAAYGPLLFFHLWYPFVRLRDVLSLYVPLAAYTAVGGVALLAWLWRRTATATPLPLRYATAAVVGSAPGAMAVSRRARAELWRSLARVVILAALFSIGLARLQPVLGFQSGFFTFGYLLPNQRRSLESLATLTEPGAVVACSLNSGAVELYGGRPAVRPGSLLQPGSSWTPAQWLTFAAALQAAGRPLYLLMDSPEMDPPLAELKTHYTLTQVATLDVPEFFLGGGSFNMTVPLYRVMGGE